MKRTDKSKWRLAVVAAFCLGLAPHVAAAQHINAIDLADGLLLAGEPRKACILLDTIYGPRTTNVEALARYGECYLAQGQSVLASHFYQRVLQIEPEAPLIEARLAGIDDAWHQAAPARTAPAAVLAEVAPASVPSPVPAHAGRIWIERYYDSNVNSGTSSSTVEAVFGGIPLVLAISPQARQLKDQGTRIGGQINVITPMDELNAVALFGAANATLQDRHTDFSRQNLAAGVAFMRREDGWGWQVQPGVHLAFRDGGLDTASALLRGRVHTALSPQTLLALSGTVSRHWVQGSSARSGWEVGGKLGIERQIGQSVRLTAALGASRLAAGSAIHSAWAVGPEVGVNVRLTDRIDWSASYELNWTGFDATSGLFPRARRDTTHNLETEVALALPEISDAASLSAYYAFSVTDSTIALFDSDRHEVGLRLSVGF